MREIVISIRAQKNIANPFEYLELKWSIKVREEFARKMYNDIKLIQIFFHRQILILNTINV